MLLAVLLRETLGTLNPARFDEQHNRDISVKTKVDVEWARLIQSTLAATLGGAVREERP